MNNKNLRGKTLFIFLTLVITFIFGFLATPVYGASYTTSLDDSWNDENNGATDVTSGYIATERTTTTGAEFQVSNTVSHSGSNTRSFWMSFDVVDELGYWNLTSDFTYISNISIWFYPIMLSGGHSGNDVGNITFYDLNDNEVLQFRFEYDNKLDVLDYDGTHNQIYTPLTNSKWYNLVVTHISGNEMNYSLYDENNILKGYVEDSTRSTNDWVNFSYIIFNGLYSTGSQCDIYFDDFNITISTTATGDVSMYDSIGSTSCSEISYGAYATDYLETKFTGYLTTTVHALDLLVGTADDDPNNYKLWLNGIPIGSADYLFSSGSGQIARWTGFSVDLDNQQLVAEWQHYEYDPDDDTVWRWVFGTSQYIDINGDGYKSFRLHDNSNLINGIYDGATAGIDVCWKFYFDPESWTPDPPNPSWTDDLEFSGEGYLGVSPYDSSIESYMEYTNVFITWGVSDIVNDNYMYIYDEDWNNVGLTQQVYYGESFSPLKLLNGAYDGTVSFVPYNYGNYTVTIERNSVEVANKTFFVYPNTENYWLYSVPNPSLRDNSYNVYYGYNNSEKDGYLLVFDPYENDIDWGNELQKFYIGSGSSLTGYVTYYPSYIPTKNHLWVIFIEVGNNIYVAQKQHTHIIRDDMYSDNVVSVAKDNVQINDNQIINYYHNYAGGEVYLFINGVQAYSIGNVQSDSIIHLCDKVGSQNVSMKVLLNDTWYLLSWDNWQTTYEGGEIPPPEGLLPSLGETFGAILGIILIAMFVLLPLVLTTHFSRVGHTISMPNIVYVLMGALGVLLDVFLGLFEVWVIYFIIAVGVLSLGLFYILNIRSNNTG